MCCENEIVIEQLKHYVTPAGKIQAIGRTMHCGNHELIYSVGTKQELLYTGCTQSLYLFIRSVIQLTSNFQGILFFNLHKKCCSVFIYQG